MGLVWKPWEKGTANYEAGSFKNNNHNTKIWNLNPKQPTSLLTNFQGKVFSEHLLPERLDLKKP